MKRTGAPAGGSGGPKRSRGPGGYDDEGGGGSQTFEEELMMMDDENMGDERIDMDDQDDPMVQVKRWSRPAADAGFDPPRTLVKGRGRLVRRSLWSPLYVCTARRRMGIQCLHMCTASHRTSMWRSLPRRT